MSSILAIIANVVVFAVAAAHFGLWVYVPMVLVYFVGMFQALASAR